MESPSRAWPLVKRWIDQATNEVTTLPADPAGGEKALQALEVTERSVLGALALHTGGLSIDHGWLRVLGGPALLDWNDTLVEPDCDPDYPPGATAHTEARFCNAAR